MVTGWISKAASSALELLLPLNCVVCNRGGSYLCESCEAPLRKLEKSYCPRCSWPGWASLCHWCTALPLAIDGIRAAYQFEGAVREMVHALKYRNLRAAAPDLGRLLASYLDSNEIPADVAIPVPLHPRRKRERGYNQSELMARELSKRTGVPVQARVLRRTRNAAPQVSLNGHEERRRNIDGAFECGSPVEGLRVLLIDDVVTTGSTM